jgi:hypothetical protein
MGGMFHENDASGGKWSRNQRRLYARTGGRQDAVTATLIVVIGVFVTAGLIVLAFLVGILIDAVKGW